MSIGDEPKATPTMQDAARAQPFGYVCARCSRCCRGNRIQLNPYEAARLARRLGIGTREFRMRHTIEARGAELSREADGTCVLLGPYGCTVHADRPLVCRLYPLGRKVSAEGTESFHRLDGHPESDGRFDGHGTVGDYLEAQGAVPYMRAADAYFDWVCRAQRLLGTAAGGASNPTMDTTLSDMDAAIAAHSRNAQCPEPLDIEERRRLHLEILDRHLAACAAGRPVAAGAGPG